MDEATRLRSMVQGLTHDGPGRQRVFPPECRAALAAFARGARADGLSYPAIAALLGVSVNSVFRWSRLAAAASPPLALVPVAVADEPAVITETISAGALPTPTSPTVVADEPAAITEAISVAGHFQLRRRRRCRVLAAIG